MPSTWGIAGCAALALIVASFVYTKLRAPGFHVRGKHAFITGGSLGIGLAAAKKYAAAGAKVTIIARRMPALEAAKKEIESVAEDIHPVCIIACNVAGFDAMERAVATANAFHNRVIDHVICCAGYSVPGFFADQEVKVHHQVMDVNFFGVLHTIKAALPSMKANPSNSSAKDKRRIAIVSSGHGLISYAAYASYSPSKYALRGLAEALRNELLAYDILVSIYYPGNVRTPGFTEQEVKRPDVTKTIDGVSIEATPESAAQTLIDGLADGQFAITNEALIFFLRVIANGVNPRNNTPLEVLLMPLIVVIQLGFGVFMDTVVTRAKATTPSNPPTEQTPLVSS